MKENTIFLPIYQGKIQVCISRTLSDQVQHPVPRVVHNVLKASLQASYECMIQLCSPATGIQRHNWTQRLSQFSENKQPQYTAGSPSSSLQSLCPIIIVQFQQTTGISCKQQKGKRRWQLWHRQRRKQKLCGWGKDWQYQTLCSWLMVQFGWKHAPADANLVKTRQVFKVVSSGTVQRHAVFSISLTFL